MPIMGSVIIFGFLIIVSFLQILPILLYVRYTLKNMMIPDEAKATAIDRTQAFPRIRKYRDCFGYFAFYPGYCIYKGWNSAQRFPEFMSDHEHDVIIVLHEEFAKKSMYGEGIDLLIEFFRESNIAYKIYHCYDLSEFETIVNNPDAVNLWIFGHGSRGSISCGNQRLKYEKLKDCPKKLYINQFHCNHGTDASLAEYLSEVRGFVSNRTVNMIENRVTIRQILKHWKHKIRNGMN